MHSAVRNVMRLFDRIKDFEKRVLARSEELGAADRDALLRGAGRARQLLAPLAPHLAEELWIALGNDGDAQMPWPGRIFAGASMSTSSTPSSGASRAGRSQADALVRDGPRLPPLRATAIRSRQPCSPARTAARALTSPTTTSCAARHFEEMPQLRAPAEHLALRGAAADRRRLRAGARRALRRLHPPDPRRPARRGAGPRATCISRTTRPRAPASPTRTASCRCPSPGCWSSGKRGDRLRLHRQRRHRRRLARGQGRGRRVRVLSQPPRGHEGPRLRGARREGLPGGGQLRRSQPPLPRSRRSDGHGVREHHPAPVLRRGRQDGGVRDRRAARLAGARPHRHGGRRRHALLAPAQGPRRAAAAGARRDRRHAHPHRPAQRLQPDRQRDPRRGGRDPRRHARDRRALAGDRRARRRLPGDRRRAQTRRHRRLRLAIPRSSPASTCSPRPRAC